MQFIVLSLIGIPASAKTSLAQRIVLLSRISLRCNAICISFDDHIDQNFNITRNGKYKDMREELIRRIENVTEELMKTQKHCWCDILTSQLKIQEDKFHIGDHERTLIILDDNNYFRSMRQRNRSLCKKLSCGHFQIFLKSSLEEANERNKNRSQLVPEPIIEKMLNQLEMPKNPRTITIDSLVDDKTLLKLLNDRIEDPEKLIDVVKTQQRQSIVHEMDIITRREINKIIQRRKSSGSISSLCTALNRKRKEFLEGLRSKEILNDVNALRDEFYCYIDEETVNFSQ